MNSNIRKNHRLRIEAFDFLNRLKNNNMTRKAIIDLLHHQYKIPKGTLYDWYSKRRIPHGRRGQIQYKPELYYILGALLGDGCIYKWKATYYYVILVGNIRFTKKYARILSRCTNKKEKPYIDKSKNIWFVRTNNYKLFSLVKESRIVMNFSKKTIINNVDRKSCLLFIEGFFDAEGCVKIIKEKVRKIPKICLDITNTNKELLDQIQFLLYQSLRIKSRYSVQKADEKKNKKVAYHLRIYKKEYIRKFFLNIQTIKLTPKKASFVKNWLNNGK